MNLNSNGINLSPDFFEFVGPETEFDDDFKTLYYHLFKLGADANEPTVLVSPNQYALRNIGGSLEIETSQEGTYVLLTTVQFKKDYETTPSTEYVSSIRRKNLQSGDDRGNITVDGSDVQTDELGKNYIQLSHADILKINSVTIADEDPRFTGQEAFDRVGESVITDFTFDNGYNRFLL